MNKKLINNQNKSIYLIIIFIFLNSCISKKQILYLQDINDIDISKVFSSQNTLQANDILNIDVSSLEIKASIPYNKYISNNGNGNSLDLIQLKGYLVSNNKTISFPVLGEISVEGKTEKDVENFIKNRLESEGHLINPVVVVRLINAKVTILGEVRKPGTYTFTEKNISLLQAIGLAGDLTIDASRKDIKLIREFDGKRTVIDLDLTKANWINTHYQNIQPNDVIIVNPNSKKVTSAGLIGNVPTVLSIASVVLSTIILIR